MERTKLLRIGEFTITAHQNYDSPNNLVRKVLHHNNIRQNDNM